MAASMSATLQVVGPAIVNQPLQCLLTVSNTGNAAANINTVSPKVFGPSGTLVPPGAYMISAITASPQAATAQASGSQLNIQVGASSNVILGFTIVFFGPVIPGSPTQPTMQFSVGADVQTSDGSVFGPATLFVAVGQPVFGQSAWIATAGASAPPSLGLQFGASLNSAFLL